MSTYIDHEKPLGYQEIKSMVAANIEAGDYTPIMIEGEPGCGKSTVCVDVAVEKGGMDRRIAEACMFRPSLHTPVDLMGVPYVDESKEGQKVTKWAVNGFIRRVNAVAKRHGFALLIWDELAQSTPMMLNAINGCLLDRALGDAKLDPNVFQVATGNRQQDRAGSGRLLTHTANRLEIIQMGVDPMGWKAWAIDQGMDAKLIAFHNFRKEALMDFDPSRTINATPRSWGSLVKFPIPPETNPQIYFRKVAGRVGEGWAKELQSFLAIFNDLVAPEEVMAHPDTVEIPVNPSVIWALLGSITNYISPANFDRVMVFVDRLPLEYQTSFVIPLASSKKELATTQAYQRWMATTGYEAIM